MEDEGFNDWGGRGCDDFVPGEVTKTVPSRDRTTLSYMVGKLAPNSTHLTRGLIKYVPGRSYFRAVPSQNGDKFVTSPPPSNRLPGRMSRLATKLESFGRFLSVTLPSRCPALHYTTSLCELRGFGREGVIIYYNSW